MKHLRTLVTFAAALLLFAGVPFAQYSFAQYAPSPGGGESRVSGRFVANQYNYSGNQTYVAVGNAATGTATITLQVSKILLPDGRIIFPFNITSPIIVGNQGTQEMVTPTAVSNCVSFSPQAGQCSVTGSFTYTHGFGEPIVSGSAGVAEAVYDAFLSGGGMVNVDNQWAGGINTGCSGCYTSANAALNSIVPYSSVSIEDTRFNAPQYWNATPATTTVLATVTAPSGQVACDATHQFCSDSTVAGSASWSGTVYVAIACVDIMGNTSPVSSTTASFTSVVSKAIDIASPAAQTGCVGWIPYLSVSAGTYALAYSVPLLTQPTALQAVPLSANVCTLTTLETITPACAIANTAYGQATSIVGKNALFTGGAQFTGYPVVTSQLAPNLDSASAQSLNPNGGGHTIYAYVPSSHVGLAGVSSSNMTFPITTAAQTTIGQVAGTIQLAPGFMNYVGRTIEVCGMLSKTSTTADTITNIQLWWDAEGSNVTAGTAVQLSNIQITQTLTAAASIPFCQDLQTTVASTSATGGTILPGFGWMTETQVAAGTIHTGSSNVLFAAVGSLNLALNARLEIVYNHTTGTDGAGVLLLNPTVKILN